MPPLYIDTMEDFLAARGEIAPVFITSKTHGKVLVPCANTILVRVDLVVGNTWNPNHCPPDKMNLLLQSILENGFCFPIVVIFDDESGLFIIIDGFHRRVIGGAEWLDFDYLPLVVLPHDMARRLAATYQFNKAKGTHAVDLDAELIRKLIEQGLTDEEVGSKLGIDLDTVHRYKQVTGVAELFRGTEYSRAWEMVEQPDPEPGPGVATSEGGVALAGGGVRGEVRPVVTVATGSLFPDEAGLGGGARRRRPRK